MYYVDRHQNKSACLLLKKKKKKKKKNRNMMCCHRCLQVTWSMVHWVAVQPETCGIHWGCQSLWDTIVSAVFESPPVFENSKYRFSSPYLHPQILRDECS